MYAHKYMLNDDDYSAFVSNTDYILVWKIISRVFGLQYEIMNLPYLFAKEEHKATNKHLPCQL